VDEYLRHASVWEAITDYGPYPDVPGREEGHQTTCPRRVTRLNVAGHQHPADGQEITVVTLSEGTSVR
jgi:hypothetical protein